MFKGYCFTEIDGWHTPEVILENEEVAIRYALLQRGLFKQVKVVDEDDYIVIETIDGKGAYPPEFAKLTDRIDGGKNNG